ncbi:ABC transporter substrate-binding protein [Litoribacter ruber]|uniref:PhnD/SsuA/transferrin family substrate-binding protein n=1 Tax=Litoribacter ruber TaxID=702568 RepID=UPI001BD9E85F|nr:PhnD/SsuA/transferrin family substrate-binding protein [Litoribacter ruber]MBT0810594.1 ABC transporter substrate-binding protein [Litoribacter ruber]
MKNITITGVPEHFNFPWIKLIEKQPFKFNLTWKEEPKGSGAMIQSLQNGETDVAILLTESYLKAKVEKLKAQAIGYHVKSPLTWGIHVPSGSEVTDLAELQNHPFLISRLGSGSHLMAFLLAKQKGWALENLKFDIIGDLNGARNSFATNQPQAFLWEKYTTKPFVDNGEFRRIGSIPTPWPCFVIVASHNALENHTEELKQLQKALYETTASLKEEDTLAEDLSKHYQLKLEDIKSWLKDLNWATDPNMEKITLLNTMTILEELGLIDQELPVEELVDLNFVKLT